MTQDQYHEILRQYQNLKSRRCVQSGNTGGAHYLLAYALMQAGINVRGLDNAELEGEAIRVIGLYKND